MNIVFCHGKYWYKEGLVDQNGRISLISIKDNSRGSIDIHELSPIKQKEIQAAIGLNNNDVCY